MRTFTLLLLLAAVGCEKPSSPAASATPSSGKAPPVAVEAADDVAAARAKVAAERAKLSPEDHKLVDAQEWCVISDDEQLGSMGAPLKLDIKGQPVFVCCKGCKKKAEADPDKTLAKVAELKAKKAAAKP